MPTQEYYIRKPEETEARGPFTLEQLNSLAENGQVDGATLYYDAANESWTPVGNDKALYDNLFPAKKNLRVRSKEIVPTLNTMSVDDRPITVGDMLAAADGRTEETKDHADPLIAQGRAAQIGLYSALITTVICGVSFIMPHIDVALSFDLGAMLGAPIIFLGVFYLALSVVLALGATESYPFVRFAAMLGFGFVGTLLYFDGQFFPIISAAAAALGLYLSTIVINIPGAMTSAALGILGSAGLAFYFFTT
jgi:GYF domain 2